MRWVRSNWAAPSGLPGWDVRLLVAHIVRQIDAVGMLLGEPEPDPAPPVTGLSVWAVSTAAIADRLDASTRETAAGMGDPAGAIDAAAERLEPFLDEAVRADRIVPHVFGAMRALDMTVTRLVELVVHGDDLARATGVEVAHDRQAVAAVTRLLADALAVKAPGNSVEVRIPPYAARPVRGGPPAHPWDPAERRRDRSHDVDPARHRSDRLEDRPGRGGRLRLRRAGRSCGPPSRAGLTTCP
ncbi:uncharacterized protein (TIGR03083 family) [Streptomyces sp. SPB162]|nr:uncharacterized protein (TIGR03083 family) [Streptomyces sp. SPB162]